MSLPKIRNANRKFRHEAKRREKRRQDKMRVLKEKQRKSAKRKSEIAYIRDLENEI